MHNASELNPFTIYFYQILFIQHEEHEDKQHLLDESGMGWGKHRARTASAGEGRCKSRLGQMHGEWRPSEDASRRRAPVGELHALHVRLTWLRLTMSKWCGWRFAQLAHASSPSHAGNDIGN